SEFVEPRVVFRNEVRPLHDRQRLGLGQGTTRHERRGEHGCGTGGGKSDSRVFQEPASRDTQKSGSAHLDSSLFSWRRQILIRKLPVHWIMLATIARDNLAGLALRSEIRFELDVRRTKK